MSWVIPFKWALRQFVVPEFESILSLLSNVFICRDVANGRIWKLDTSRMFSSKVFFEGTEDLGY